jgi:hypothetical protein
VNRVGKVWVESGNVQPGEPLVVILSDAGDLSVSAAPSGGGTVLVEYCGAPPADVLAEASPALWFQWQYAAANAAKNDLRIGPTTAVRITAVTGPARYELAQRGAIG